MTAIQEYFPVSSFQGQGVRVGGAEGGGGRTHFLGYFVSVD